MAVRRYRESERPLAELQIVTPGYFDTVNTPIRLGRDFDDGDLAWVVRRSRS